MSKKLKNPPLIEAIFEVRWKLQGVNDELHYDMAVGRLFEALKEDFPYSESLPASQVPKEISRYAVRHRFRSKKDGWPLFQLGHGILTFNQTNDYTTSEEFIPMAANVLNCLFNAYPDLEVCNLALRYIDAIDFDYDSEDVGEFLKSNMGIATQLPDELFGDTVNKKAKNLSYVSSYCTSNPKGQVTLKINTGQKGGEKALIWEQLVQTLDNDVPEMPNDLETWLTNAHKITESWFFCLIEKLGLE